MKIYAFENSWDGIVSYHQYSDGAWSAARSYYDKRLADGFVATNPDDPEDYDIWLENKFVRVIEIEVQWEDE